MPTDFSKLPAFRARVIAGMNDGLTGAAIYLSGRMKASMQTKGKYLHSAPGTPPNVQRGLLRRSITSTPGRGLRASAGTNVKYGIYLEKGAIIRAKGKLLPVPVNPAAKRLRERTTGSLRSANLRFIKTSKGNKLLIGNRRERVSTVRNGQRLNLSGVPVFILKEVVVLKKRPWAVPAMRKNKAGIVRQFVTSARKSLTARLGGAR